jgi:FkbM family methyltransferase
MLPKPKILLDIYEKQIGAEHIGEPIKLKELFLAPYQSDADRRIVSYIILDTLTPYLLNLDINRDYLFMVMAMTHEGPYERKNVRLETGDITIDAGANIGDFTVLAAYKGARVHAFEPSKIIIEKYLKKTIDLNPKLSGEIVIAPYALSDIVGEAKFKFDSSNFGASQLQRETEEERIISIPANKKEQKHNVDYIERVNLTTLDTYVHQNNLKRVDFIKADIEGAERLMLKGARDVLRDFGPKLAICTYHLPDDPEVLEGLVMDANPKYVIEHKYKKMYAYVPKET